MKRCERIPPPLTCARNYPTVIASKTVDDTTEITAWEDSPMERQDLMVIGATTWSRDITETLDECALDGCAVVGVYKKTTNVWLDGARQVYTNMRGVLSV